MILNDYIEKYFGKEFIDYLNSDLYFSTLPKYKEEKTNAGSWMVQESELWRVSDAFFKRDETDIKSETMGHILKDRIIEGIKQRTILFDGQLKSVRLLEGYRNIIYYTYHINWISYRAVILINKTEHMIYLLDYYERDKYSYMRIRDMILTAYQFHPNWFEDTKLNMQTISSKIGSSSKHDNVTLRIRKILKPEHLKYLFHEGKSFFDKRNFLSNDFNDYIFSSDEYLSITAIFDLFTRSLDVKQRSIKEKVGDKYVLYPTAFLCLDKNTNIFDPQRRGILHKLANNEEKFFTWSKFISFETVKERAREGVHRITDYPNYRFIQFDDGFLYSAIINEIDKSMYLLKPMFIYKGSDKNKKIFGFIRQMIEITSYIYDVGK